MIRKYNIGFLLLLFQIIICFSIAHSQDLEIPSQPDSTTVNSLIDKYYLLMKKNTPESELDDLVRKGLDISKNIGFRRGEAVFLSIMGQRFNTKGDFVTALEYDLNALKIFEETADSAGLSPSYNSIGVLLCQFKDYPKAIEYFNKSIEFAKYSKDQATLASLYINLALCFRETNSPDTAITLFKKGYLIAIETNSTIRAFSALNNMAFTVAKYQNQYIYALSLIQKADSLLGKDYPIARRMVCDITYGYIYNKLKMAAQAAKHLENALEIAQKTNAKSSLVDISKYLSETYFLMSRFKDAYLIKTKYESIQDSITKADDLNKVAYMNFTYNQAKKDNEISILKDKNSTLSKENSLTLAVIALSFAAIISLAIAYTNTNKRNKERRHNLLLLEEKNLHIENQNAELESIIDELHRNETIIKQQNEQLEQANIELQESNRAKDKFFTVLAHDLKNPFQYLLSMTSFLYDNYTVLTDEKKVGILKDLSGIVVNTHKLLENLLLWAKYQLGKLEYHGERIVLMDFFNSTSPLFKESSDRKSIRIVYSIDDGIAIKADKYMLSTILRNLVSNAIKFTHTDGEISIVAKKENGSTVITVEDNGVGIEKARLEKLFDMESNPSTRGTAQERGTGLGLMLAHDFAQRMDARLVAESELGKGSRFSLIFAE